MVATIIGVETGHQLPSNATALVAAGLLSVIIYPLIALRVLEKAASRPVFRPDQLGPPPAPPGPAPVQPGEGP